jgi:hypothetical protein
MWKDNILHLYSNGIQQFTDWADFERKFRTTWGDPNKEATARHHIAKIKQGDDSADAYTVDFKVWAPRTGYNDQALIEYYK